MMRCHHIFLACVAAVTVLPPAVLLFWAVFSTDVEADAAPEMRCYDPANERWLPCAAPLCELPHPCAPSEEFWATVSELRSRGDAWVEDRTNILIDERMRAVVQCMRGPAHE